MRQTWTKIPLFEAGKLIWKLKFMDGKLISKLINFLFQRFMGFERQAAQNKIPPFESA
jgi:hypothetical protein